jgi:putative DNA primase/helicase
VRPLRPGSPTDRVTLHTDVVLDADATCPRFERFLTEVFEGDDELIDYIRRAVGYSLSGDISEQCLFVCYGD